MTVTTAHAASRSAGDVAKAGGELRKQLPDLSDAQVRKGLVQAGFPEDAVDRWLRGEPEPGSEPATPAKKPAADGGKPPALNPRSGAGGTRTKTSTLWRAPGTPAGVLLALVCYPAGLAYLRDGGPGLKAWFKAKFLNQTSTDPGIASEVWRTPGTLLGTGGAVATGMRGRTRAGTAAAGAGGLAIAFARSQIGKPYRWGAAGPNAWDCSGLTMASWRAAGVRIPRTTTLQLATLPRASRHSLQIGDLIFPEPTHVQLYAGGGRIIEAPHTGLDVREAALGPVMAVRRPGTTIGVAT